MSSDNERCDPWRVILCPMLLEVWMNHFMISTGDHARTTEAGNSLVQLAAAQLSLPTSPNFAAARAPCTQAQPSLNRENASVLKAGALIGMHKLSETRSCSRSCKIENKTTDSPDPVFISAVDICALLRSNTLCMIEALCLRTRKMRRALRHLTRAQPVSPELHRFFGSSL